MRKSARGGNILESVSLAHQKILRLSGNIFRKLVLLCLIINLSLQKLHFCEIQCFCTISMYSFLHFASYLLMKSLFYVTSNYNRNCIFWKFLCGSPEVWKNFPLCIIHRTSYTIHHTPYIIHTTSYTIHNITYIIHLTSYTLHHTPYIIHHTSYTLHHTPNII